MKDENKTKKQLVDELETLKTQYRHREIELENVRFKCQEYFENLPILTYKIDLEGKILNCNNLAVETLGYDSKEELIGKEMIPTIYAPKSREKAKKLFLEWKKTGEIRNHEMYVVSKHADTIIVLLNAVTMYNREGQPLYCLFIHLDITERKKIEEVLKRSESELKKQKNALEQKNIALREIISQIELEKIRIKEEIEANMNLVLNPILERLKADRRFQKYADLIMHNINGMTSSYGINLKSNGKNLTPREMEICNLVKGGLVNKDIASLLHVSSRTIEKHRQKIRCKLGITNKDINLTSFLHEL